LNLDGNRIPRIELPDFLDSLLRRWDIRLPSPFYTLQNGYLLVSESAEAILTAQRAMQRNDVLPKTAEWRNIAGRRPAASAFSLYYSLDHSIPFFLRGNTVLSAFLGLYQQGLLNMSFNQGQINISLALVPGIGGGISLVSGYPFLLSGNPSNRIFGGGDNDNGRIFFSSGSSAFSINLSDNSIKELPGQNPVWIISANNAKNKGSAWVVSNQGRVTLVNNNMEINEGFPLVSGLRISSMPVAFNNNLYLCDENGGVYVIDEHRNFNKWETDFISAIRSPPSFLSVSNRGGNKTYAAVYPKSFFGELWLLDTNGKVLPGWPVPVGGDDENSGPGIAFGSPLLFASDNRIHLAFITQAGQLSVYNESGKIIPGFPKYLEGVFFQQPVFDGEYLWLICSEATLFRLNLSGEILRHVIPGFKVMEEGFIGVFTVSGSKIPEIFISGEANALYGFSRNFRSLEGFPLPIWGKPVINNIDGKTEIIGIGMDRRLYRYRFR